MRTIKGKNTSGAKRQTTQPSGKAPPAKATTEASIKPRPAFCPFTLEQEPGCEPRMRSLVCCMHDTQNAPNVSAELDTLYMDALGRPPKFSDYLNVAGNTVFREKHKAVPQKTAVEDLVKLALTAVKYVELIYARKPELCREVAGTLAAWPVSADLTERSWERRARNLIEDLKLGFLVEGFIRSGRTANENPIRRFATEVYHVLSQTRHEFKTADDRWRTRENCPPWAAKTQTLPRFTKANARAWANLGKEMVLERRRDFIEDAALKEQKFKWAKRAENRSKSGKVSERAILNEAFDDFAKELRKLAPTENIYRGEW